MPIGGPAVDTGTLALEAAEQAAAAAPAPGLIDGLRAGAGSGRLLGQGEARAAAAATPVEAAWPPITTTARSSTLLERFGLAAIGAVALTAERADSLADELAKTGGMRRDEARELIEQTTRRWRGEAVRASERAGAGLEGLFKQLGLVSRSDFEEL